MNFASRKKKSFRKKQVDEEEDDGPVVIAKPIKRKKILTSMESEGPELKYEKRLLNTVKEPTVSQARSGYSKAELEEMKLKMNTTRPGNFADAELENPVDVYIPDEESINATKKLREERRKQAEQASNVEYIPIHEKSVAKAQEESRLEVDEDELDAEEAFDDYKGKSIVFGMNAVKEAKELAKKEKLDLLQYYETNSRNKGEESDDEQVREWEMQRIHLGKRAKQEIILEERGLQKPISIPIPNIPDLLPVDEIVRHLQYSVDNLKVTLEGHLQQVDVSNKQIMESNELISKMKGETEVQSQRFDYFQELSSYIRDLAEFMDAKMPILEQIEQDILDLNSETVKQSYFERYQEMDTHGNIIFKGKVPEALNEEMNLDVKSSTLKLIIESDIDHGILLLFEDASKNYKNLSLVKAKLETWKLQYPKEYEQAYGSLSLAGVFDMYVRHELLNWNPLESFTKLENMKWHDELSKFGMTSSVVDPDDQLVASIVEKTIIPKLRNIILNNYDVYSNTQTDNLFKCLNNILDYVSKKSNPFQDLLDSLEDRITDVVKELLDHVGPVNSYPGNNQEALAKEKWLESQFKLIKNIMIWKKYFPTSVIKRWVYEKVVARSILICLETCINVDQDTKYYQKISDCVRDFIPNTNSTPADLKFLESSFLRLYSKIEKSPSRLWDSQGKEIIDSVSGDYEDSFTLDTFADLCQMHLDSEPKNRKGFIIARVQTWDPKQPEKVFYSYYNAFHLNKILFQTQIYLKQRYIHRLHVLNPLTNSDIIGNVLYFHVSPPISEAEAKRAQTIKTLAAAGEEKAPTPTVKEFESGVQAEWTISGHQIVMDEVNDDELSHIQFKSTVILPSSVGRPSISIDDGEKLVKVQANQIFNASPKRRTSDITLTAKFPNRLLHVNKFERINIPPGVITRFTVPLPKEDIAKIVPATKKGHRRSLSYRNAISASGVPATFLEWTKMIQEDRQTIDNVSEEDGNFDNVKPFTITSTTIASPEQITPEGPSFDENVTIFDGYLFATDSDYLKSSEIRQVFRSNAINYEEIRLFEMEEYKGEQDEDETQSSLCEWM